MDNIFQSDTFYEFLESLSFLEAFKVEVARDGVTKGRILGYIQKDGGRVKQFFSRRAIVNGGPMLADDITEKEIGELLHKCVETLRHKAIYIEFRNYADYSEYREVFERCGFEYEPHYNFHIDTSNRENIDKNMHKNPKRTIKASLAAGAEIVENPSKEEAMCWYEILRNLYSLKVHTPLFPKIFFVKAYETNFIKPLLVRYQGEIIGGGLYVIGNNCVYEWFICGKDGEINKVYPSTLGTYAGMCYAAEHKCERFDMMGAGSPNDGGYGVRDFKAKFGGELVEHGRFRYVCNKTLYNMGVLAVKGMKSIK